MILKLLLLGIWMVLVPWGIGYAALWICGIKKAEKGITVNMGYALCLGYILMWAAFQLIAVPFVLKMGRFPHVEMIFEIFCITFLIAGIVLFFYSLRYGAGKNFISASNEPSAVPARAFGDCREGGIPRSLLGGISLSSGREILRKIKNKKGVFTLLLWGIFLAGLLFQMAQAYRLAYADGDDAFYIPISVTAALGGDMYTSIPYTGYRSEVNLRYGLAPFPLWVAFIAKKCDVNVAVAAHSLMPLILIPVTYILYLELGKILCRDVLPGQEKENGTSASARLPLFMIFVTLLQIFGNYSIYPASTFLLTRTRQGKAALGNVILPFFILLLCKMAEEVKKQGKAGAQNVFWLMAAMTAGCLCSTMAGFLCGLLVMLTVFLIFILYRKPQILWQGFLGCVPAVVYALLYLRL